MNVFESLENQIIEEANKTPVAECCGLVEIESFKFNIPVFRVIPFKNNARFSANNFEMNPYKFLNLAKTKKIYALYHSHIYTGDEKTNTEIFSEADIALSETYKIPLILF
jgi:proteasome lid subunit RPN8/RPN11